MVVYLRWQCQWETQIRPLLRRDLIDGYVTLARQTIVRIASLRDRSIDGYLDVGVKKRCAVKCELKWLKGGTRGENKGELHFWTWPTSLLVKRGNQSAGATPKKYVHQNFQYQKVHDVTKS
jgi:hypothetical protein